MNEKQQIEALQTYFEFMCMNGGTRIFHISQKMGIFKDWRFKSVGYFFDVLYCSLCFGHFRYMSKALKGYIKGFKTIYYYEHES